jgi:hypothetical protein
MESTEPPAPWFDMFPCRTDAPCNATALSQSTSSPQHATELVDLDLLCSQFLVDDPEAYLDGPKAVEISAIGPSSPIELLSTPLHNPPQPSPPVGFSETINPSLLNPSNEPPWSVAPIPPSNDQAELPPHPTGLSFHGIGSDSHGNWYTTPPSAQEEQTYDIDWEDIDWFLQSQSQEADYDHGFQIYLPEHTPSATTSDRSSFAPSFILPLPPRTSAETETPRPRTPAPAAAPATTVVSEPRHRRRKKRLTTTQTPLISSASVFKEIIFTVERGNYDAEGVGNGASRFPQPSCPVANVSSVFSMKTILLKDVTNVKPAPIWGLA